MSQPSPIKEIRILSKYCRKMSAFKHISSVLSNDRFPVHKYKSETTGLTIVIGEVNGPIINGNIVVRKFSSTIHSA